MSISDSLFFFYFFHSLCFVFKEEEEATQKIRRKERRRKEEGNNLRSKLLPCAVCLVSWRERKKKEMKEDEDISRPAVFWFSDIF